MRPRRSRSSFHGSRRRGLGPAGARPRRGSPPPRPPSASVTPVARRSRSRSSPRSRLSKPMSAREMSLTTTASSPCARASRGRARCPLAVLRREAHQRLPGRGARQPRREDVGGRLELDRQRVRPALAIFARPAPPAGSRPRAAAISSTSAAGTRAHGALELGRRLDRDHVVTPSGAGSATFAHTSVTSAPRRAASVARRCPSARTSGCPRSAPSRSARACPRPSPARAARPVGPPAGRSPRSPRGWRPARPAGPRPTRPSMRARPCRARRPAPRARAGSRGSRASRDAPTSGCSSPARARAAPRSRAPRSSAGCRRRPRELGDRVRGRGATQKTSQRATSSRCEIGSWSGRGSPGKARAPDRARTRRPAPVRP